MTRGRWAGCLKLTAVTMTAGVLLACGGGGNSLFSGTSGSNGSSGSGGGATNPVPALSAVNPATAMAGTGDIAITVTGNNFVTGSQISFNKLSISTQFVDDKTLTAKIPGADVTASGSYPITVANPTPGGGTSASIDFAVINPSPAVTTVAPAMVVLNGGPAMITLTGTGFVQASQVAVNGSTTGVTTTYQSATALTATIPNSMLQTLGANLAITVVNPAPGGGVSTASVATAARVVNPSPTLAATGAVAPAAVVLNAGDQTLSVSGTNFISGAQVQFNGIALSTQFVSSTQLTATLPAVDLSNAGTFPVTVTNPSPSIGPSAAATFTVNNPVPALVSVSPAQAAVNSPAQTLTITGSDFIKGAQVTFNGAALNTTFVSANQLTAVLPSGDLTSYGTSAIGVTNPAPTTGIAAPLSFQVTQPQPAISSVTPGTLVIGAASQTTLTVNGTGFTDKAAVQWNGTALATTFVSSTQLTAVLPDNSLNQAGTNQVTVALPDPGGIASPAYTLTVDSPVPQVTGVSPISVPVGSGGLTLTVNGSGFFSGSQVALNGTALSTTFVGATQLTAAVPSNVTAAAAAYTVSVVNPAPVAAGSTTTQTFTVAYPAPVLQGIAPTQVQPGSNATITLTISGYLPGQSVISFNGQAVPASSISTTNTGQYVVSLGMLSANGVFPFTVMNPTPGGGASNSMYLTVGTPANQGPIAVVAQPVAGSSVDVAYVPIGNTVHMVQVDGVDPTFLPINGFVERIDTDCPAGTPTPTADKFIDCYNPMLGVSSALPFNVDFTVADLIDGKVLAGSKASNQIAVYSIGSLSSPSVYAIPGISGTVTLSDGDTCSGICGLQIDTSGISGRASAVAMTPSGVIRFNPTNGTVLSVSPAGVIAGEHFGYVSSPTLWGVLNPSYQASNTTSLQFINAQSNSIINLTNPVGTRPDSAAIDSGTLLGLIPDEGTGINTLLNLNALIGVNTSTATLPATTFTIPGGVNCATRPDWTLTAIDPQTHLLAAGQEMAGCVAAVQLAANAPGSGTAPAAPTQILFGLISAPQASYSQTPPWGKVGTGTIGLDPDGILWINGNEDHLFAIFTSVITGKPTMISVEGVSGGGIGKWMAEVPVSSLAGFPGSQKPLSPVQNGEVSPADMATLTTFIRIQ